MTAVRDGRPDDLPALRAIQTASLDEPWPELLSVATDGPPLLLVATESEGDAATEPPVGYALAVVDGDDGNAYLAELAVAPGHRSEGHGSELLDALIGEMRERGVDELRLTVRVADDRAVAFYRERGFEYRARLPDHYERGDGLLLGREIAG